MPRPEHKKTAFIVAVLFLLGIIAVSISSNHDTIAPSYGLPLISEEYALYEHLSIDQIVDDEKYIYVLLGDHDGVVQIFDPQGNHVRSATLYKHMNGAFRIAAQNGYFYVRDYHFNIYVFHDGTFSSFLEKEEASDIIENVNFNRNSANYDVRLGSIWRVTDNVQIITRPVESHFINTEILFYISIAFVLIIGCIRLFRQRAETK